MAIILWVIMLVLVGSGWFLRSISRRHSPLSRRRRILSIVGYAVWATVVMIFMLWIGGSRMNVVGPLFFPVTVILAVLAGLSDDIGRLVRHVSASKRND